MRAGFRAARRVPVVPLCAAVALSCPAAVADGAGAAVVAPASPWPVERAARLIARHHVERASLRNLPRSAGALLERVRRVDPEIAIVPAEPVRTGRLGVLSIDAPNGRVLVPQPAGPAWRAGLVRPVRLDGGVDPERGRIVGTRLDTGDRVDLTVARGPADEGAVRLYRLGGHRALAVYSFVGGRTVDSARWRLSGGRPVATTGSAARAGVAKAPGENGPVVLDLRYCAGGDVFEATDLAGLWLDGSRPWTTLHRASGPPVALRAGAPRGAAFAAPEAVLVSEYTASACEQLVRGLVHNVGAAVLGGRTAGKCTVQTTYRLDAAHAIRFTTGLWSGPGGEPCDPSGIAPDRRVRGNVHSDEDVAEALDAFAADAEPREAPGAGAGPRF